jgi:CRISPR/Cas system-associated exonuclease Cas4 (RecB family)
MTLHKLPRILRLAAEIKTNPWQTVLTLCRSVGVGKAQFYRDKQALEEMNGGKAVLRGYIYYAVTGRRQEVEFSPELRQQTLDTIAAVRQLIESGERPPIRPALAGA